VIGRQDVRRHTGLRVIGVVEDDRGEDCQAQQPDAVPGFGYSSISWTKRNRKSELCRLASAGAAALDVVVVIRTPPVSTGPTL